MIILDKFKIDERTTIGIDNNGLYYAEIRDEFGDIERVITRNTQAEIFKELEEAQK